MGDYVVYQHVNKTNGKRYIGITKSIAKRWCNNGIKYQSCPRFAAALNKYGWDNFSHEIIEQGLTFDEANDRERFYIAKYKTCDKENGYNIQEGGQNQPTMLGKHHTEKTKQKMREKALGRVISEEQKRQHSATMTGKMVGELNHKSRAVRCITTGETFETQRSAAKAKGVQQAKISLCCQGKRNHTHGLKWEYFD